MATTPPIVVRTSVVQEADRWMVRVRFEQGKERPEIFVGPFPDQPTADKEGRNVAKLVRQALGVADA